MRTLLLVPAFGLAAALLADPPASSQDPSAATDLFARDLHDWTRLGDGPNPWRLTADRTLVCAAAADALTPDREFADGTLRFEYRFRPVDGKTSYKASLSVRREGGGGRRPGGRRDRVPGGPGGRVRDVDRLGPGRQRPAARSRVPAGGGPGPRAGLV